jgi:SAM-dependent methyltransferase
MTGDFIEKQQEQQNFFTENEIKPSTNKIAFDLGAGNGLQTVSLSNLGFDVKAVDFNRQLLDELAARSKDRNVEIIEDDILNFLKGTTTKAGLIVCMGDTLTHLPHLNQVDDFIIQISRCLEPGGRVVLSFRDLTNELTGEQRFIPVKADDSRVLTCFLEYFSDHVMVHDILYEKQNGKWIQKISAYPKVSLDQPIVVNMLENSNIQLLKSQVINRMIYLLCEKRM